MGNFEFCAQNRKASEIIDRPTVKYQPLVERYKFLLKVDNEEIINYAKKTGMPFFKPYNRDITQKILLINEIHDFDFSYIRARLVLCDLDVDKARKALYDDSQFRKTILPMNLEIQILGIDFHNGLTLLVKEQKKAILQFLTYFLEYIYCELKLSNTITIVIDSKEISPWFLNSLIMMTTRYFIFNIRRVFLVNFELNKLSSEVIGLLSSPIYTHFVLAFETHQEEIFTYRIWRSENKIMVSAYRCKLSKRILIIMIVIFKDKQIISESKDFDSLTYLIENQFGRDLPTIYKIFFQDVGNDKIVITNEESFQQTLKYAKDQGSQILLIVDDDILPDDLDIVLKRQISTEQSKIFAQSQHEQVLCPSQFLQESLYNVDNAQLNIQQIFDYYSKIIVRFRNQFIQLPQENRQQNYLIFYNQYMSLIQRMNEKLTGYFLEDISKLVNNPQIPVDTSVFFKEAQPQKIETKQQEPDPEQISVKPEKKRAKKSIQEEPKDLQQSQAKEAKPKRKLKEVVEEQMTQSKLKKEEKKAKEKKADKDQQKKKPQADNPSQSKLQQFMENPFNLIKNYFSKDPELSQLTIEDITKSIIKDKQEAI
ncbi:hypothetical protein pb186bvf_015138 [Paramecium bursaria]